MASHAVVSASARVRLEAAAAFVAGWPASTELIVVGATREAADDLCRGIAASRGATFGLHRFTLGQLASRIATATLAGAGVTPATSLATDALATRALFELTRDGTLGYLAPIADSPGLPRALADTLGELREAGVAPARLAALGAAGPDLGHLGDRYAGLLAEGGLADRSALLETATARLRAGDTGGLAAAPIVLVDVPIATVAEQRFVEALVARAAAVLATIPAGDARTLALLPAPLAAAIDVRDDTGTDALARVRRFLFAGEAPAGIEDDSVRFFSAPGESREAVEVSRRILDEAARGVPFDEMAIVVRAPESYWGPIEQALERAKVPAWFSRGTRRPDPTGRAFLALLACAADDLSARSFAEYLSLGQVPRRDPATGRSAPDPPPLVVSRDEALAPGQLSLFDVLEQAQTVQPGAQPRAEPAAEPRGQARGDDQILPTERSDVRAPWRWESLLVDAAVASEAGPLGRAARWHRRLGGLRAELELRLGELKSDEPESGRVAAVTRDLEALDDLSRFALPLVDELAALPAQARWGEWLDRLAGLAPRALRRPTRVLQLLADLRPMAAVGPVSLGEVRRVLLPRLAQLDRDPPKSRFGQVFVATPDALRGRTFRVVFVVGLAERVFPQRSREDPLLLDAMRRALNAPLAVEDDRVASERVRLRLAVGAATERCWLSYPRLDVGQGRARVPSFYALDVVRASTGAVPDHVRFEHDTAIATGAWLAWPAPDDPASAIDVWEHDLAVLGGLLRRSAEDPPAKGSAHYLLADNAALRRSLRTRYARWKPSWSPLDGLVGNHAEVPALLAGQRLTARPYSVSALQRFSACPYQFLLGAIYRFQPLEQPEAIVQLDPLTRGAIFHEIQRDVLRALRSRDMLPIAPERRGEAQDILRDVATAVFDRHHDRLAPAIERVWEDEITLMHGDLRLWLGGVATSSAEWVPRYFELSFGLPIDDAHDEASAPDPIVIDGRFPIRGAIDLVEVHGALGSLRVTDHKTGRNRTTRGLVVGGGGTLQPIIYTLVAERLLERPVSYARLSFSTTAGGFTEHPVSVRDEHRRAGIEVLEIIDRAVEAGALPQSPRKGACHWCDFRAVCGPLEEQRAGRKNTRLGVLDDLAALRGHAVSALADAADRERIRTSLDETFAVEAAAGTGKTTVLVDRIVNVLASGRTTVERIVAVTFSEKAAGELKLRLRAELETRRQAAATGGDVPSTLALAAALANLEQAHVSTIHTFCADLLRERPVEARIDPRFTMLTEPQARALFGAVFHDWLQARLEAPPPGVRRALRRRSYDDAGPIGRLERAAWTLAEWRDFSSAWDPGAFDQAGRVDALAADVFAFATLTEAPADYQDALYQDTEPARRVANEVAVSEQVRPRDYDGLEAQLVALGSYRFKRPRTGRKTSPYARGVTRPHVLDAHTALVRRLDDFKCDADADLAARLRDELATAIDAYEAAKSRLGALDFLDLLVRARDLVRGSADVRAAFQRRFTHLFVDEFQDTDPLQAEILLLLAADDAAETRWRAVRPVAGKLFVVGDPKQSIYRFRRADVGIYESVREQLRAHGAACVALRSSFRAVPDIQRAVNAAFAPRMTGNTEAVQASYVPLAPVRPAQQGQPAIVALPVPKVKLWNGAPTKASVTEGQPHAVAAFVDWLVKSSGWTVTDRERPTERAAIQARDVCLLFRRFDTRSFDGPTVDVTRPYVQALEARGLPHLLVGGKSFHEREEVETLRTALAAIEWPDDELSVFGTLRGALFAFGDDVLLAYRDRARTFHPFRVLEILPASSGVTPDVDPLPDVAAALRLLRDLHLRRNQRPVAATIASLLDASRAHAIFALRPSGEQALANVQYVGELARQYEAGGGLSFRGFVERLRDEAEETRAAEAPILEEGSDGVRLMTVHKAKGLEFPVVVLVDIGAELSRSTASRWVDSEGSRCAVSLAGWAPAELRQHAPIEVARDEAEGVRVAYVAATRARDLLVVCAVGDRPWDGGWVSPLNGAIYPAMDRRREAIREEWAGQFGPDTTVEREDTIPLTSMRPGIHRFEGDEPYAVTWWDPGLLDLDRQPTFGLRREELIAKDAAPGVVDAGLETFARWRVAREAAVEQGSRPSHRVVTVRARAAQLAESATFLTPPGAPPGETPGAAPGGASGDVRVEAIPRPEGIGAGGVRFGALVHAVLALVPLDGTPTTVAAIAAQQARVLAAEPAETDAAARVVSAALAHPAFAPLRDAATRGALRREVPVALAEPTGAIVEGVVDAAFETDAGWVVVDFKTDADPGAALDAYLGQVRLYARAIAAATSRPASGLLLRL